jgi:hypothetical protein
MWIEAIFKLYPSSYMEALGNTTTDPSHSGSVLNLNQGYFSSHQQS